jgi:hypothetical protein
MKKSHFGGRVMGAWWQSLETVERISHFLNWSVVLLTAFAAVAGIAAVIFAERISSLRTAKDIERQKEVAQLTQDLQQAKEMAAPAQLTYRGHTVVRKESLYVLNVQFQPSKNTVLGEIQFSVEISGSPGVKVFKVWPSLDGGPFLSGNDSARLASDGRTATLTYALMGPGRPTLDIEVTGPCQVIIGGNYLAKAVAINVQDPASRR